MTFCKLLIFFQAYKGIFHCLLLKAYIHSDCRSYFSYLGQCDKVEVTSKGFRWQYLLFCPLVAEKQWHQRHTVMRFKRYNVVGVVVVHHAVTGQYTFKFGKCQLDII